MGMGALQQTPPVGTVAETTMGFQRGLNLPPDIHLPGVIDGGGGNGSVMTTKTPLGTVLPMADPGFASQAQDQNQPVHDPLTFTLDPTDQGTMDQGTLPLEQGTVPLDQGTIPMDQGTVPMDQGTLPMDQGTFPMDQGTPPVDVDTFSTDPASHPLDEDLEYNYPALQRWPPGAAAVTGLDIPSTYSDLGGASSRGMQLPNTSGGDEGVIAADHQGGVVHPQGAEGTAWCADVGCLIDKVALRVSRIVITSNIVLGGANLPPVNYNATIVGKCAPDPCKIDGEGRVQLFLVDMDGQLTLKNLELTRGKSVTGGAVFVAGGHPGRGGKLVTVDVQFTNNEASVLTVSFDWRHAVIVIAIVMIISQEFTSVQH
ncbi:hypothetical protein CBR_g46821 [Chara braunii]|uniref:Uncharacterized protein n=1 Tax=Chara braunii TaxID=69332 RepID=A0A388M170_CHABU|nr:hypothetical protein CBR_g46821 [Chara braunii]|eukprot:GBG88255.1 hypothetical protein CBR_g46821 [Chara braunii]